MFQEPQKAYSDKVANQSEANHSKKSNNSRKNIGLASNTVNINLKVESINAAKIH